MSKYVFKMVLMFMLAGFMNAQTIIPKRGFAVDWVQPLINTNPMVMKFDKIEVGVHLTDTIYSQIANFINENNRTSKINPFNPEDIDIFAEFKSPNSPNVKRINAFYFEDFKRNTASKKFEDWSWSKINSGTKFRIRFMPDQIGKWSFIVYIKLKNQTQTQLGPYEFSVRESDKKGFVKVASNNRYLELGGKSFLPIGQNLPKATCYFAKDSLGNITDDPFLCSTCPCAGIEEWCSTNKGFPMYPKVYMSYLEELERFKKAGGNYYRFMIFPHNYEIEYEKLGNYASRQNIAWEMDRLIEKSENLDLKVHFNMMYGYPLSKAHYGVESWDWYSNNEKDKGYCYQAELNLTEPIEFLTNELAKKHYKNKIRYIIARWGYSTSIAMFELINEINNKFQEYPLEMYAWHNEMAQFIKEELGHNEHILTVNYDGTRPEIEKGDESFKIPYLDVITHNCHRASIHRSNLQSLTKLYREINKPLIFSEIGTGDLEIEKCDNQTEWIKDLWAVIFSGTASAGLNWNEQHNFKLWEHYKAVENFTKEIDFNEFDDLFFSESKNRLVELNAIQVIKSKKAIGMIQNTTWNYYTTSTGGPCKTEVVPDELFREFKNLSNLDKLSRIELQGYGKKKEYQISWFDPFSNKYISNETIKSNRKGRLKLNYPELTKDLPFVVYKLNEKNENPIIGTSAVTNEEKKVNKKNKSVDR